MKKISLLKIIESSILEVDISTRALYQKYYPLIAEELNALDRKLDFDIPHEFSSKSAIDSFARSSNVEFIEYKFKNLLEILRINVVYSQKNAIPTGVEQANMRLRLEKRIGTIVLHLPEENSALRGCLNLANKELNTMIFPKNDKNVLQCYLLLMEALDDIDTADEAVTLSRITNLINQWKSLSR